MNKLLVSAALAGVMAAGASTAANAADAGGKEKCYGVAEVGKNDCASADGSHSCAGHATKDKDANEWKYVMKGECEGMGGSLTAGTAAGEKNSCDGKNSCKGQEKNSCEGKNSCKGEAKE